MIETVKQQGLLSHQLTPASKNYQNESRSFLNSFPYLPSERQYNLTVCHDKKFIWFRVAKVGTRTIFDALQQAHLKLDAEQPFHCHYPVKIYQDHFKFAFVRNPWDRLVSCWRNKVIDQNYFKFSESMYDKMQSFGQFVDYVASQDLENGDIHLCAQSRLIDLNHIDFIGRFESFEKDLETVLSRLGITGVNIQKKNASINRASYKSYYNEALIQKVGHIYAKDIQLFSYVF